MSGTEAMITLRPDVGDLVPPEALPSQPIGDSASVSSFPKVLRRRLSELYQYFWCVWKHKHIKRQSFSAPTR